MSFYLTETWRQYCHLDWIQFPRQTMKDWSRDRTLHVELQQKVKGKGKDIAVCETSPHRVHSWPDPLDWGWIGTAALEVSGPLLVVNVSLLRQWKIRGRSVQWWLQLVRPLLLGPLISSPAFCSCLDPCLDRESLSQHFFFFAVIPTTSVKVMILEHEWC